VLTERNNNSDQVQALIEAQRLNRIQEGSISMRPLAVCTALAVLIAIAAPIPVQGRGKRKGQGTIMGRIAAMNPGSITIAKRKSIKKRAPRSYTFALAQQTAVVLSNGRPAPPNALEMGVRVRVSYQVAPTGTPVAAVIQIVGR
jgi:hypothetical protein